MFKEEESWFNKQSTIQYSVSNCHSACNATFIHSRMKGKMLEKVIKMWKER